VAFAALVAVGAFAATAHAVFPGANGRIVFGTASWGSCDECDPTALLWSASRGARPTAFAYEGRHPAFSPDGRRLAFADLHGVYIARPDGSRRRALTRRFGYRNVAWSRQGDKLAFTRMGRSLFVVGARGGSPRRLFSASVDVSDLAWAPSGAELAFASYGLSGEDATIHRVALDGSSRELGSGWHVSWSAAGWLAYERGDGLYLTRAGSAEERRLVPFRQRSIDFVYDDIFPRRYSWSPDGKRIAFMRGGRIHVARAAGGEARPITPRGACCPQWSPDGRWVAFARGRGIFVVRARGGRSRLFTRTPGAVTNAPGSNCPSCDGWVTGLDWQARPRNR
jgi:dipeptidyl aminopeptidase/acylaminoacyl peptidase